MIESINALYPDVMLYCRTVVETGDYVSTGVTTYAEGDLIEVELSEYERFSLKDTVKVSVYTPVGLLVFRSTVIAIAEGSIVVLGSPQIASRFGEVRQHPRVPVAAPAFLYPGDELIAEKAVGVTVDNISLGGVGFKVFGDMVLPRLCIIDLSLNDRLRVINDIEIVRKEARDNHLYYGARFLSLPNDVALPLRSFIMRRQVDLYYERKQTVKRKNG